ncbi:hypothetical protein C0995_015073, partial [Termitomyces sp. Mi166
MFESTNLLNSLSALYSPNRTFISALLAIVVASRVIKLLKGLLPPGAVLPTTWWNPGICSGWNWRKSYYSEVSVYNAGENFSLVPFLVGPPAIYTSNLDVMRQILTGDPRTSWRKTEGTWGPNLVASQEGEVWRKYRRVVGPAFNNILYRTVWAETLNLYRQMEAAEGWSNKTVVDIPSVQVLSTKMALLVIARCGFGFSFDWSAPPADPDDKMSVQQALRLIADSYIIGMMIPKWMQYLPLPGFAKIRRASEAFSTFMEHEIAVRTEEIRAGSEFAEERADALTMLVRANEQETGKLKLSDQEVIGNVFILLFAGHETTAHTLSATLALLAIHQDIQNEIFDHIVSVIGYDRDPVYNDHEQLNKVLATFYEALRLFPAAYLMLRESVEDTVLNLPNPVGVEGSTSLAVKKGTTVVLDLIGVQYNPRYFDNPDEFRPSRWYNTSSESEAFSAFSLGPRACIGRKFATVEATVFLTMLLRDWDVTPIFEVGETTEAWRKRVLSQPVMGLTLGIR